MKECRQEDIEVLKRVAFALESENYVTKVSSIWLKKIGQAGVLLIAETERSFMSVMAMLDMSHNAFRATYIGWVGYALPTTAVFCEPKHATLNAELFRAKAELGKNAGVFEITTPENEQVLVLVAACDDEVYSAAQAKIAMMLHDAKERPDVYGRFFAIVQEDMILRATTHGLILTEHQQRLAEERISQLKDIQSRSKSLHKYQVFWSCWNKVRTSICW